MAALSGGVCTSLMEMVRPDWAAKRKPTALIRSRLAATTYLGEVAASSSTITPMGVLRLPTTALTKAKPSASPALKNPRPGVVSYMRTPSSFGPTPAADKRPAREDPAD